MKALTLEVSDTLPVYLDGCAQTDILLFFFNRFILEKQTLWDFLPANPENYVTLGSYFQLTHASNPEPPLSLKTGILKNLRAVRSDLLVKATLGRQVASSP
jgi:hypothetical protein